jgi:recombination protein RecR
VNEVKKAEYPETIRALIQSFRRLPGIGPKSAERIAVWVLRQQPQAGGELAVALAQALQNTTACEDCGFFMEKSGLCTVCSQPGRDAKLLCVVEQPTDILPLERTGAFHGLYHALGGRISPLDNVGPEDLRLAPLLARIRRDSVAEVILAVSSDVEGEATANYLAQILKKNAVKVSRIAQGLPAGGGLEQADELTLFRALSGRREIF